MLYAEYKKNRQKQFNDLPIFYAFNVDQFSEAMQERGLTADDTDKVLSIGAGGYILKKDKKIIDDFFRGRDPLDDLLQEEEFLIDAVVYEMKDHEYSINWEGDYDVMSCFGHIEYSDDKNMIDYARDLGWSADQINALPKAIKRYKKETADWY